MRFINIVCKLKLSCSPEKKDTHNIYDEVVNVSNTARSKCFSWISSLSPLKTKLNVLSSFFVPESSITLNQLFWLLKPKLNVFSIEKQGTREKVKRQVERGNQETCLAFQTGIKYLLKSAVFGYLNQNWMCSSIEKQETRDKVQRQTEKENQETCLVLRARIVFLLKSAVFCRSDQNWFRPDRLSLEFSV